MLTRYTEAELRAEINKQIDQLIQKGNDVHPAWVTTAVCKKHSRGLTFKDGDDGVEPIHVAFWRFCGNAYTRKLATACINDLDKSDDGTAPTEQRFLPGFMYLRPQYVVTRDGVDVMVATEKMTVAELKARAHLFERNSVTLAEHARELHRYAEMRETKAASGE